MSSPPPSPRSAPETPALLSVSSSFNLGYFSAPFERFARDDAFRDWSSAFTLLDTIETYFDSRMDLLERRIKKHSDKFRIRAEDVLRRTRTPHGELVAMPKDFEKEIAKLRAKLSARMTKVATAWQSTKVVRTWEKISFFFGVMVVLSSALMFGLAPEWIHVFYTVHALYLLPARAYTYKQKALHYFLFDLCYYTNILNFVFLWFAPHSPTLFVACYCLNHGSLASAVITWRNSLVFHDWDKVTSVFIHIYPPFVFTVIRHFYHNASERFPAVARVPHMDPLKGFLLSGIIYMIWQGLYWKFVIIDRRKKIEAGLRTTSFSYMLHDKRSLIGRMLAKLQPQWRELSFMTGQLLYALLTELPAIYILYDSAFWSGAFLLFIFSVSVWNGGSFYIEVFGRKFERELEALRKEIAESAASKSGLTTPFERSSPSTQSRSIDGTTPSASPTTTPVADEDADLPADGLQLDTEPPEVRKAQ